jgi:D-glycero-D-manno-heptose 1,7-bisphosphate phosphatase
MSPPALFLDRDGTLIDVVRDEETGVVTTAFHPRQLRLLPGVVDGLRAARDAGYVMVIATNQPGPAKGHFSADAVARTNHALVTLLAGEGISIARVEACIHHPEGGPGGDPTLVRACDCRKPKPGMLRTAAAALDLDLASSWMVGDTGTDVETGRAAGVRTAMVFAAGRCELCPLRAGPAGNPDLFAPTFDQVVAKILAASATPPTTRAGGTS